MVKQLEEFNIGGQQHFNGKLEARGNEIKTMFTSRINFNSSGLDVTPPTLFRWRGYGNWFQVPTYLEHYTGRNGEEDIFLKNGRVRQTRPRPCSRCGPISFIAAGCNSTYFDSLARIWKLVSSLSIMVFH